MKWLLALLILQDRERKPVTDDDALGCALVIIGVVWFMVFFYLQFLLFPGQYWVTVVYVLFTAVILSIATAKKS